MLLQTFSLKAEMGIIWNHDIQYLPFLKKFIVVYKTNRTTYFIRKFRWLYEAFTRLFPLSSCKKIIVSAIFASCCHLSSYPQKTNFIFRHLTTADGLASNNVNIIIQDSYGFMWFGTECGIQKYDGYTFKSFHHEPSYSNGLPEDRIGGLFEDPNNDIWVRTHFFGFSLFNPVQELPKQSLEPSGIAHAQSKPAVNLGWP